MNECSITRSLSTLLQPHGLQHVRLPAHHYLPEFAPVNVHWGGDAIQSSHSLLPASPFAFNLSQHQSFFWWSDGQSIGASASALVLPMNIQCWFPLGLTGLISWQSKGLGRVFSSTTVQKHQFFSAQPSSWSSSQSIHDCWKTLALTIWTFVSKVMSLLFNMPSRFVIAFLPRSKHVLISWLQVTICNDFGVQENKGCHYFHCFSIYLPWSDGTGCHDLRFRMLSFKPTFSLSSFTFIKSL